MLLLLETDLLVFLLTLALLEADLLVFLLALLLLELDVLVFRLVLVLLAAALFACLSAFVLDCDCDAVEELLLILPLEAARLPEEVLVNVFSDAELEADTSDLLALPDLLLLDMWDLEARFLVVLEVVELPDVRDA